MNTRYTVFLSLLAGVVLGAAANQGLHAQTKLPAYIFTEFEILDKTALKEFSTKISEVTKTNGAKYLVRRGRILPLEGEAPKFFTVQVFANVDEAMAFRNSQAWKELTPLREKALRQRSFIAEGLAN